jgi:hypothetical protein
MTFESKGSARSKIVINYPNILVQSVKNLEYVGSHIPYSRNEDSQFIFCGLTAQLDLRLLHCWGFNISVSLSLCLTHKHAHTRTHTHTNTRAHTHTHTRTHTHAHTHTHTRTHTHTHTHTRTHTHTHVHIHTHTHTCMCILLKLMYSGHQSVKYLNTFFPSEISPLCWI